MTRQNRPVVPAEEILAEEIGKAIREDPAAREAAVLGLGVGLGVCVGAALLFSE